MAQQNHSMFLMHYLPESNLLNPAIPISCRWYIGIPVFSSTHFNYGNSSFSFKNAYTSQGNGNYTANVDGLIDGMKRRNYIGTELHMQLLALGYRRGDYSFMFTVTEKNNVPLFYPKEVFQLALAGNTQFEGESVGLKGTALYFQHIREYALSISKNNRGFYYGLRAKLLFGKLNTAFRSTNIDLYTNETTFNLDFSGDMKIHTSLPLTVETEDGTVRRVTVDDNVDPVALMLNRKNPGFAIDAGVIYPYSDKLELSASIINLGFIRWRSNLNTFNGDGDFSYEGPLGDTLYEGDYFQGIQAAFQDSMKLTAVEQKYTSFLPTRIIGGANYAVNDKLKAGVQGQAVFYRQKVIPALTLSANYNLFRHSYLMASYTVQYNTFRNFGLGLVVGRNPFQFYVISDNVAGFIWPLSTRNVNIRFGMNINLGCKVKEQSGGSAFKGNCMQLERQNNKAYRKRIKK